MNFYNLGGVSVCLCNYLSVDFIIVFLLWKINNFCWLFLNGIVCGYDRIIKASLFQLKYNLNVLKTALKWKKKINQNKSAKKLSELVSKPEYSVHRYQARKKIFWSNSKSDFFFDFFLFLCVSWKKSYDASALVKHSPD